MEEPGLESSESSYVRLISGETEEKMAQRKDYRRL